MARNDSEIERVYGDVDDFERRMQRQRMTGSGISSGMAQGSGVMQPAIMGSGVMG